jgi:hypothetical protein
MVGQSRYGSESGYPTSSSGSDMSLVLPAFGSTLLGQERGISNHNHISQDSVSEQTQGNMIHEDTVYVRHVYDHQETGLILPLLDADQFGIRVFCQLA